MAEYIKKSITIAIVSDSADMYPFEKNEAIRRIEDSTPAEVAPVVHGRWEWIAEARYRCNNCGRITQVDECMGKPMYSGCPYCRAKMDLEDCP